MSGLPLNPHIESRIKSVLATNSETRGMDAYAVNTLLCNELTAARVAFHLNTISDDHIVQAALRAKRSLTAPEPKDTGINKEVSDPAVRVALGNLRLSDIKDPVRRLGALQKAQDTVARERQAAMSGPASVGAPESNAVNALTKHFRDAAQSTGKPAQPPAFAALPAGLSPEKKLAAAHARPNGERDLAAANRLRAQMSSDQSMTVGMRIHAAKRLAALEDAVRRAGLGHLLP